MTTPIYDTDTLPRIVFPIKTTQDESKRYLGGTGVVGKTRAEINVIATSDAELNALHTFWRVDCNYGLEGFYITLPLFGTEKTVLALFSSDFTPSKDAIKWALKIPIILYDSTTYVLDDSGDYVIADTGAYVVSDVGTYIPAGEIINFEKDVLWQY